MCGMIGFTGAGEAASFGTLLSWATHGSPSDVNSHPHAGERH